MADPEVLTLLREQMNAMQILITHMVENKRDNDILQTNATQRFMDLLGNSITEFMYDPQSKVTFGTWYAIHEDIFLVDGDKLDDTAKVRLLLRNIDPHSHSQYINFILPKKPAENSFADTVVILKRMFGEPESLFRIRYNCFKLAKKSSDDCIAFASIVNKECERFDFAKLTIDQFKCLIFIARLQTFDKEFRTRLLTKLESDPNLTLNTLTGECKRLMDLKIDADLISQNPSSSSSPHVKQVGYKPKKNQNKATDKTSTSKHNTHESQKPKIPYRPCWLCGDKHFVKECPYVKHTCKDCNKTGYKEGFCDKSQPRKQNFNKGNSSKQTRRIFSVSKLDFAAKRKFINVDINGYQTIASGHSIRCYYHFNRHIQRIGTSISD